MSTFYIGPKPVLRGQNTNDMVNPYTTMSGKVRGKGTYSYYPLYNTSQLLTGGPDNAHEIGTGRHPGNVFLSQLFKGTSLYLSTTPLAGTFADGSATYEGARYRPLEYKGLSGSAALNGGHAKRSLYYGFYNNYIFDGVPSADAFSGTGHGQRTDAEGAANSFGFFIPTARHGVASTDIFTTSYGQANTASDYGRYKVKEWKGVASSQAL